MSGLLVLPGFPNVTGPGQENLGHGFDNVTGLTVTPDGRVMTPAAVRTLIETSLNAGLGVPAGLWRQPDSF